MVITDKHLRSGCFCGQTISLRSVEDAIYRNTRSLGVDIAQTQSYLRAGRSTRRNRFFFSFHHSSRSSKCIAMEEAHRKYAPSFNRFSFTSPSFRRPQAPSMLRTLLLGFFNKFKEILSSSKREECSLLAESSNAIIAAKPMLHGGGVDTIFLISAGSREKNFSSSSFAMCSRRENHGSNNDSDSKDASIPVKRSINRLRRHLQHSSNVAATFLMNGSLP